MILLIWTCVLLAVVYVYFRQVYSRFSSYGVKQLKPVPFFGNMQGLILRKHHFVYDMQRLYKQFREERFVGRFEFMNPVVAIQDLDLIKKVTIKDFEHFLDHRGFTDEKVEPLFARNLFSLRGDEWKDMRSTLSPAFTSSKIRVMVPFIQEIADQMIRTLKKKLELSGEQYIEVDCKDLTTRFSNDVIASCAFGLKMDSHEGDSQFYEMGKEASQFKLRQMLLFLAYSACPFIVKRLKLTLFSKSTTDFFTRLVMNTMNNREQHNIIRPDMIHLLMEAKKGRLNHERAKEDRDAGFATVEESAVGKKTTQRVWSDSDLIAQAVLFFVAGFETVSIGMCFALHEIAQQPDIQEKLAREIKENAEQHGGKLEYNSIQNLPYLDMVVSETLRLWPPLIQLDRVCEKDYNLGRPNKDATQDYIIRKGELLSIPVFCIHRDGQYFEDPEKFDPERFSEDNKHFIKPMTYLPFGSGPRNCIGSRFALLELKIVIYQILLHMEVSPSRKTCIPSDISTESFNLLLKGGHWLNFKLRQ